MLYSDINTIIQTQDTYIKSCKLERVMCILWLIVYCSFNAITSSNDNMIADALSRENFQKFRQITPMISTDSCGFVEPSKDKVKSMLNKYALKSTWNIYENVIQSFERFRNQFGTEII